jgi:hypothetical protein
MYYYYLTLIVLVSCAHSLNMGTSFTLSNNGMEFAPNNSIEYLYTVTTSSLISCATTCSMALPSCHTFEYDSSTLQCRLIEGDLTTGQIITSTSSLYSIVGTIELIPEYFTSYGQSCSSCVDNPFFMCINNTCQCAAHSYFDGTMCRLQQFADAQCNMSGMCRTDLNLTCVQLVKCKRKSFFLLFFFFFK